MRPFALIVICTIAACGGEQSANTAPPGPPTPAETATTRLDETPPPADETTDPAPPPAEPVPTPAAEPTAAEQAAEIFKYRCIACHGETGRGDGPAATSLDPKPRNWTDQAWQAKVTDAQIETVIVKGGPAVGMSPLMPPNPDLADKPEIVRELRAMVRAFGKP